MVVPPPQLAKRLVLRQSLDRRLCLLRARGGIADDKARLDGVAAGSGFTFDPVISRCVVSGESLATLVGHAVVGNTFHSGLALADWRTADRSYAATTAQIRRESTPPPCQTADPAPRAARVVRRSARGQICLLRARADPGANARIDAIAASGGFAVDPVIVPRDDDSLTTLVDRIAVDANGALTVHFGEDIRASPPSATIVSAVKGHLPETASKECESSRSSLIFTIMMPVPAPEAAGEACTPRAADAAKAGPLPSSSALAVGAAKELGTPIGDGEASRDKLGADTAREGPDEATQQAEGDRAAARLQARVKGHQSRLGSTTPFVAPVKEFDVPLGAGTPNQRGAFETRCQAVDDAAASVAKVDVTLNDVGATAPKGDGASIIATFDGRSPQVERADVVALQMARTRGPTPLGPHDSAPSPPRPSRVDAAIDQSRATPSRDAMHRALDAAEDAARRTFAAELRRRAMSSPDDRTRARRTEPARLPRPRDALFGVEGAPERPAQPTASTLRPTVRADDRAPFKRSYEAWHRRKRDEARARREQLMEALVRAERERERRIDDRRAALRERRRRVEREKRALARAQAQHRKKQRVRRTPRPPIESGLPAVLDEPCVAVVPEVKKTDARVRAFEDVFLPKIVSRANNKGRLERRSLNINK
ncbi:unnamed protein product [Pelagomonas calceolata]|uniref:Uncharacterized protein n=1 Tax=Pelagomonas calceolata TaxID=35677 RepID=A0A8J2SLH2_9STRA|nr:unnamed protein product [Pelagomonas calceolata]